MAKWNLGLPGGPAGMFYSIVDQNGMVIVLQAGSKEIAEQIIREHEAAQQSFAADGLESEPKCLCPADGLYPGCPVHGRRRR